jgi:hypothetical protein
LLSPRSLIFSLFYPISSYVSALFPTIILGLIFLLALWCNRKKRRAYRLLQNDSLEELSSLQRRYVLPYIATRLGLILTNLVILVLWTLTEWQTNPKGFGLLFAGTLRVVSWVRKL